MGFNAQLRCDIETLDVTINNYERMENAPEAWSRIKNYLEAANSTKSNTTKDKIIADIKEFLINKAVSKKAFGLETWITDRFSEYDYRQ